MSGEMQTREQMLAGIATPCAAVEGAGSEAMRAAIDAGLRAFCSDTSDFTMSSAMRRAAADFIMGQPGMFTAPPARTYAEGVEPEPFAYFQRNEGWGMWEQVAHEHRHEEGVVPAYRSPPPALATSRSQHEGASTDV